MRLVAADLYEMEAVQAFTVECRNEESIHMHDTYAVIMYDKRKEEAARLVIPLSSRHRKKTMPPERTDRVYRHVLFEFGLKTLVIVKIDIFLHGLPDFGF